MATNKQIITTCMSEKDLVKELKAEIVEITKDRDDALDKVKARNLG